jgi:hypothetical protein
MLLQFDLANETAACQVADTASVRGEALPSRPASSHWVHSGSVARSSLGASLSVVEHEQRRDAVDNGECREHRTERARM